MAAAPSPKSTPIAVDRVSAPCEADAFEAFAAFVASVERPLRQALVARYGTTVGRDAVAHALGWAWEHQDRLLAMSNPVGYLYRVAQSSTRSGWAWRRRTSPTFPPEASTADATDAVDLGLVVAELPEFQRICVLLIHAHRWRYAEVAALLGISVEAVTNHVHRGTRRLRQLLKEEP